MCGVVCFFFFKQKTAYEMRISDWSSDVCSSDLGELGRGIMHDDRAVDLGEEAVCGGGVLGDDRVGMAARMGVDMRERARDPVDRGDRDDRVRRMAPMAMMKMAPVVTSVSCTASLILSSVSVR